MGVAVGVAVSVVAAEAFGVEAAVEVVVALEAAVATMKGLRKKSLVRILYLVCCFEISVLLFCFYLSLRSPSSVLLWFGWRRGFMM